MIHNHNHAIVAYRASAQLTCWFRIQPTETHVVKKEHGFESQFLKWLEPSYNSRPRHNT